MPTPEQLENRKTWVTALRSGAYQQGRARLKTVYPDGTAEYCCLGVFAECMNVPKVAGCEETYEFDGEYEKNYLLPEYWFTEMLGFTDQSFFTKLNDDDGRSFSEIATVITVLTEAGK